MGYLPEALRNYLVRLGWSHGDKELFSTRRDDRRLRSRRSAAPPSRFDFKKLENVNAHFMRSTDSDALFELFVKTLPYLPGGPELAAALDEHKSAQLRAAMPGLKARAETLAKLVDDAQLYFRQAASADRRQGRGDSRQGRPRCI